MTLKSKSPKQQSQKQKKLILKSFNKVNQYDHENINKIVSNKNEEIECNKSISSNDNNNFLLISNHVITHTASKNHLHQQTILSKNPVNVILNNSVEQPIYFSNQSSSNQNQHENLIQNNILNSYWNQNQTIRIDDDEMTNQI